MAGRQGIAKGAGGALALVVIAVAAWPAAAQAGILACDDAVEESVALDFTDPVLEVKVSAAYFDAPGAGDQLGYRYKGRDGGQPTMGSGICTNDDENWQSLQITLGGRDDSVRLDAKKPAVATPTARIPAFVDVGVFAGQGDDFIKGHAGFNLIDAGGGADKVISGGGADIVDCGGGNKDVAIVDKTDKTARCEKEIVR